MTRLVSVISSLLIFSLSVGANQVGADVLSEADKAEIIESVLELELLREGSVADFAHLRRISSQNIEFVEPWRIAKHGFTLVPARELGGWQDPIEYQLFTSISVRDGVASITVLRVTESWPCFGPHTLRERKYTYESRRTAGRWVAQLIGRPVQMISFPPKTNEVSTTPR